MRGRLGVLAGGVLIAAAVSGLATASDRETKEDPAIAKARLTGSFYVPTGVNIDDAYCARVAKARLTGSFVVPTTTPSNCPSTGTPQR